MSRSTPKAPEAASDTSAEAAKDQANEAPKLQQVKLLKAHTHEGQEYGAGDEIGVDEPTRQWLRDNQVIEGDTPTTADQETAQ